MAQQRERESRCEQINLRGVALGDNQAQRRYDHQCDTCNIRQDLTERTCSFWSNSFSNFGVRMFDWFRNSLSRFDTSISKAVLHILGDASPNFIGGHGGKFVGPFVNFVDTLVAFGIGVFDRLGDCLPSCRACSRVSMLHRLRDALSNRLGRIPTKIRVSMFDRFWDALSNRCACSRVSMLYRLWDALSNCLGRIPTKIRVSMFDRFWDTLSKHSDGSA